MSTINNIVTVYTNNTSIRATHLFEDIFSVFGTPAFVQTYVDVYKKASTNTVFTLRHWGVMKEIFRDSRKEEQKDIISLLGRDSICFPYTHNGDDYRVDTFYHNGDRDDYHHGCEGWVVEKD